MNTEMFFECEVDNLSYSEIEEHITGYFDMGYTNSSTLPMKLTENTYGTYTLSCTLKSGTFRVSNTKLEDKRYLLSVTLIGNFK